MAIVEFYSLERKRVSLLLATAAIWSCSGCGEVICGMGGPGNTTLCLTCGNALIEGRATVEMHSKPNGEAADCNPA